MKFGRLGLLLSFALASGAAAQEIAPCAPPHVFKAWNATSPSSLALGRAKDLRLELTTKFRRTPGKLPKAGTYGGMVPLIMPKSGPYLIALDVPAWIDVIEGGVPVASIDHARAEQCTGIHKIVRFPLMAGRHVLQISGSPKATARIMVVPAP